MNIFVRGAGILHLGCKAKVAVVGNRLFEIDSLMTADERGVRRLQSGLVALLCLYRRVCPPVSVEETYQRRCHAWNDDGLHIQARLEIHQTRDLCMTQTLEYQVVEVAPDDRVHDGRLTCVFLAHGLLAEYHVEKNNRRVWHKSHYSVERPYKTDERCVGLGVSAGS
jgi:hypothetical protein